MEIEVLVITRDELIAPGILYRMNYYGLVVNGKLVAQHTEGYMVILL